MAAFITGAAKNVNKQYEDERTAQLELDKQTKLRLEEARIAKEQAEAEHLQKLEQQENYFENQWKMMTGKFEHETNIQGMKGEQKMGELTFTTKSKESIEKLKVAADMWNTNARNSTQLAINENNTNTKLQINNDNLEAESDNLLMKHKMGLENIYVKAGISEVEKQKQYDFQKQFQQEKFSLQKDLQKSISDNSILQDNNKAALKSRLVVLEGNTKEDKLERDRLANNAKIMLEKVKGGNALELRNAVSETQKELANMQYAYLGDRDKLNRELDITLQEMKSTDVQSVNEAKIKIAQLVVDFREKALQEESRLAELKMSLDDPELSLNGVAIIPPQNDASMFPKWNELSKEDQMRVNNAFSTEMKANNFKNWGDVAVISSAKESAFKVYDEVLKKKKEAPVNELQAVVTETKLTKEKQDLARNPYAIKASGNERKALLKDAFTGLSAANLVDGTGEATIENYVDKTLGVYSKVNPNSSPELPIVQKSAVSMVGAFENLRRHFSGQGTLTQAQLDKYTSDIRNADNIIDSQVGAKDAGKQNEGLRYLMNTLKQSDPEVYAKFQQQFTKDISATKPLDAPKPVVLDEPGADMPTRAIVRVMDGDRVVSEKVYTNPANIAELKRATPMGGSVTDVNGNKAVVVYE